MQKIQKPILIVDTYNFLHNQFVEEYIILNSKGNDCSVILKSLNAINNLFKLYNPKYVVFALDSKTENFRKKMYPSYKANRKKHSPLIKPQILAVIKMLKLLGFPIYGMDGFEADDIIGTLAKRLSRRGHKVIIYSLDKDFIQLIDDNISVSAKSRNHILTFNIENGHTKYNVPIEYTIDAMALLGDEIDNIPGVKGVGNFSAATLINKYGGINDIYSQIDNGTFDFFPTGRSVEETIQLLQDSRENAFLSYKLAKIKTDLNFNEKITIDKLAMKPCNSSALYKFFKQWEIENLSFRFVTKDFSFIRDYKQVSKQFMKIILNDELTKRDLGKYLHKVVQDTKQKKNKDVSKNKRGIQELRMYYLSIYKSKKKKK